LAFEPPLGIKLENSAVIGFVWMSKPVAHFDDVHVHTQGIRAIQTCVGEVLKAESRKCVRDRMDLQSSGSHNLDVPPEVLCAVFVPTEEP